MVTREEYNNALDIIEEYHKQLFKSLNIKEMRSDSKTKVVEWVLIDHCSVRLYNVLKFNKDDARMRYIEDITKANFIKCRNAGLRSWNEFVELRGY